MLKYIKSQNRSSMSYLSGMGGRVWLQLGQPLKKSKAETMKGNVISEQQPPTLDSVAPVPFSAGFAGSLLAVPLSYNRTRLNHVRKCTNMS